MTESSSMHKTKVKQLIKHKIIIIIKIIKYIFIFILLLIQIWAWHFVQIMEVRNIWTSSLFFGYFLYFKHELTFEVVYQSFMTLVLSSAFQHGHIYALHWPSCSEVQRMESVPTNTSLTLSSILHPVTSLAQWGGASFRRWSFSVWKCICVLLHQMIFSLLFLMKCWCFTLWLH